MTTDFDIGNIVSNAFLTGSQVYGKPRPESDIDVVVLLDFMDFEKLAELTDAERGGSAPKEHGISLKYGKLNLVMMHDRRIFEAWQTATEALKKVQPVTREQAVACVERELALRMESVEREIALRMESVTLALDVQPIILES